VGEAVTRRSGRTGPGNRDHATLQQRGLLILAGLDNRELPRGPSSMPGYQPTHPIQGAVRTEPTTRADREQAVRQPLWGEPLRSWPQRRAATGRSTDCPTRHQLTGPRSLAPKQLQPKAAPPTSETIRIARFL
jgi:hypothetical protein